MILIDLFQDKAEFAKCVPGSDSSVTFDMLNACAISAKKQVESIITSSVYTSIKSITEDSEKKEALKNAVANLTMAKDIPFDAIRKRKANIAVYKNEQEAMRRSYTEGYFNAMDTLISLLKDDESFKTTVFFKVIDSLRIKSCEEFNLLYPIDNSYYFFFRIIPIQKELIEDLFSDYYIQDSDSKYTDKLNRSLARMTVAMALRRFDPMELPLSIRNLIDDSTSQKQNNAEQTRILDLSKELEQSAQSILQAIDLAMRTPDADCNIASDTDFTLPDDGIVPIGL